MELVRVTTSDGLWLDGAFTRPVAADSTPPVDALILVHGTGSNFYASGMLETFSRQAQSVGISTLRINTRGHDGISSISGAGKAIRGGAAYEQVADCQLDLQAWIAFLRNEGYAEIGLCGHSMGGVKSAYTLAHGTVPGVTALILISSPRFHHETMANHPAAAAFRADYKTACQAVAEGRPGELINVTQPMPLLTTAAGFLDKYGPANHYDFARLLPLVSCPVLYVLGTKSPDQSIGFAGLPDTLADLANRHSRIQFSMIDGANTNYSGMDHIPFERAYRWMQESM
jgi:pimeloyl-ACP methyl ester carboxylesterase